MRLVGVSGSLKQGSGNTRLLHEVRRRLPAEVEMHVLDVVRTLPLYDPDLDRGEPPPAVGVWRRALAFADGIVVAAPEYAHSLPGGLKNAFDWVVTSGELAGKVAANTAAVWVPEQGRRGLDAVRGVLEVASCDIVWDKAIRCGEDGPVEALDPLVNALVVATRGAASRRAR